MTLLANASFVIDVGMVFAVLSGVTTLLVSVVAWYVGRISNDIHKMRDAQSTQAVEIGKLDMRVTSLETDVKELRGQLWDEITDPGRKVLG